MIVTLAILMVVLLAASAFFSSSETALFSINSATLKNWQDTGTPSQRTTARLMDDHHRTITTILLGNNFVNILTAIVLTELLIRVFPNRDERFLDVAAILINTVLLLAVGEVTPKAIAYSMALSYAPRVAPVINALSRLLALPVVLLKKVSGLVLAALGDNATSNAISIDEYRTFTRMARRMGVFNDAEIEMFDRVFNLRETHVGQFMIPRPDVCTIDVAMPAAEVWAAIRKHCHRYLPAVDGELDQVKGILDVTKFALLPPDQQENWAATCLLPPVFIPENGHTHAALAALRQTRQGLAFAVNEYGGIEGLLTAEDIYEQMVGDLEDEFDQPTWSVTELAPGHWRVSGLIPLKRLAEHLDFDPASSTAGTLAGFLAEQIERIPEAGDEWTAAGYRFIVRRTHRNRVLEVDVIRREDRR